MTVNPFAAYHNNLLRFLESQLCAESWSEDDTHYIGGSQPIDFYPEMLADTHNIALEAHSPVGEPRAFEFEEALLERLSEPSPFGLLFLVGGLGAGKTTTVHYVRRELARRRHTLKARFGCVCSGDACHRRPIYVNAIDSRGGVASERIIGKIFQAIRIKVYQRTIDAWLRRGGLLSSDLAEFDKDQVITRRLLLANDILPSSADVDVAMLNVAEALRLPESRTLLSITPTKEKLRKLVDNYRSAAVAMQAPLNELLLNSDTNIALLADVLHFYEQECSVGSPLNLIIVDNLDQLPTRIIENVVKDLHQTAERVGSFPFLITLRPSSISADGNVRNLVCRLHYGPDNFELLLQRLERLILNRSRGELLASKVWSKAPAAEELDYLLATAYLYALIAQTGIGQGNTGPSREIAVHPEHTGFRRISLRHEVLASLARCAGTIFGRCSRYALAELRRFFDNSYLLPDCVAPLVHALRADPNALAPRPRYGALVRLLVGHPPMSNSATRLVNLFIPISESTHRGSPSLSKLRLLEQLWRRPRTTVRELLTELALHGIPSEIGLADLNHLHNKYRLLVWFSDNQDLRGAEDYDQYVVLSEHGMSYFRHLLGDFEYTWFAASEIVGPKQSNREPNFPSKLALYRDLLRSLAAVELLQVSFRKGTTNEHTEDGSSINPRAMLTLTVAYQSLARAIPSMEYVLQSGRGSAEYREALNLGVQATAEMIMWLEDEYVLSFGNTGYRYRYEEQIDAAWQACSSLLIGGIIEGEASSALSRLAERWALLASATTNGALTPPGTLWLGMVALPDGADDDPYFPIEALADVKAPAIADSIQRYWDGRCRLRHTLSRRLPSRSSLRVAAETLLGFLREALARSRANETLVPDCLTGALEKDQAAYTAFMIEQANLVYGISGPTNSEEMTGLKATCNSWLASVRRLGAAVGAQPPASQLAEWQ